MTLHTLTCGRSTHTHIHKRAQTSIERQILAFSFDAIKCVPRTIVCDVYVVCVLLLLFKMHTVAVTANRNDYFAVSSNPQYVCQCLYTVVYSSCIMAIEHASSFSNALIHIHNCNMSISSLRFVSVNMRTHYVCGAHCAHLPMRIVASL